MTNHLFSFESFFLFPDRLCVLKRSKSLRNSVQRSLLFCVLRLFPVPVPRTTYHLYLVLPSCAGVDPTAHITHYYLMCFGTLCHGVVIGHALHPVPLANLLHMLLFPVLRLRHFLAQAQCTVWSSGMPYALHSVPVMSLLHSAYKLMIMV
jgi:hypothetical protein